MTNCPPNADAIKRHFETNVWWNSVPMLGPIIGQYASPSLPPDDSDNLATQTGILNSKIDAWRTQMEDLLGEDTANLDTFVSIIPKYIDATENLKLLPVQNNVNIIFVQLISLAILMMIIIFFGIHK